MSGEDAAVTHPVHVSVAVMVESQSNEGGMSFIHVVGGNLLAQSLQCLIPTDAKNRFLTDARVTVTAVQVLGNQPIICGVVLKISIQKIDGHPPLEPLIRVFPDPELDLATIYGNRYLHG